MNIVDMIWLLIAVSLFISGVILNHFGYIALGVSLLLIGLLAAWAWYPLQIVQNWLKNRKERTGQGRG